MPSHWLKSGTWPVGPVLKFRDIPDCWFRIWWNFFGIKVRSGRFSFDYFMWVQHLSYFGYKNLVVMSPFWVWGPLGLASMQLPVFSWIGVFCSILHVFVNFADLLECHSFATVRNITSPELRHLHYTNWWLKICIWWLYFSRLSRKGDLRILLISSPV